MDYFHGRNFGMVLLAIDLTDKQKFAALVASFFAFFLFSKKKAKVPPQVGLSFRYPFKALTSLLIMGFISYCLLPSNIRNTIFQFGMTSLLREFPEEAAILGKLLIEKKPDPAKALPYDSAHPVIGDSWKSRIHVLEIVHSRHCNILIIKGHFRYKVAVFLDSVDEATAKQIIVEDVSRVLKFERPLYSVKGCGVTLVWEDIT